MPAWIRRIVEWFRRRFAPHVTETPHRTRNVAPRQSPVQSQLRACMYGTHQPGSRVSCRRPSLPGRLYCHKHQGMMNALHRRRAKNRVAARSRRINREG